MEYKLTPEQIQRLDASNYLELLMSFSQQFTEAVHIMEDIHLAQPRVAINQVVVAGVGGSAIGGDLLRTYLIDLIPVPILVNRSYDLPGFVGPSTLLFASSYSGNTEETLSACRQALQRKAQVVGITSGGKLSELAAGEGFPLIRIPHGMPPRAALGYSFVVQLESLVKLRLITDQSGNLNEVRRLMQHKAAEYGIDVSAGENLAKQVAGTLYRHLPIVYAWERYYEAVAVRWRGELAEMSKQLSSHHLLPEMNHNEIAGWQAPADLLREAVVVFLRDQQEPLQIRRRMELTEKFIAPWAAQVLEVWASGKSLLARQFSLIYLGDFVSYYLAALNGVDPTPIDRIEELKRQLAGDS